MLLEPGEDSGKRNKKLLIVRTTAMANLVEQFTHDPKLKILKPVGASIRRNSGNRHYGAAYRYYSSDSSVRRTTHT